MTEPDEDITQLSSRKRGEAEEDDATLLSSRQLRAAEVEDDDGTVLSSRARLPRIDGVEAPLDDDATRLSHRGGAPGAPSRPQRKERSSLPPGAVGGAAAQRGSFGAPAEEYSPRDIPLPPAPSAPVATPVPEEVGAPAPREMRRRREAARHRRLITTALVFGITAAVVTAAIIGIIALVRGS